MDGLDRPVFIVGCGRSGTSLVGELFAAHPEVTYLYEPRQMWGLDKKTDVWSAAESGQIVLRASDLTSHARELIVGELSRIVRSSGRPRLVEKTPINAFRVDYIDALFPESRFVHVVRDGDAVGASIATLATSQRRPRSRIKHALSPQRGSTGRWYGANDRKWHMLVDLAKAENLDVTGCEEDMRARGHVEWELAVSFARRSLRQVGSDRWIEVHYEDLCSDPRGTMATLLKSAGLEQDEVALSHAETHVRPRRALRD